MYNALTEEKIKGIPTIGKIDTSRLPQELTRIYAQIVSVRQRYARGEDLKDISFERSLETLRELANNLETILITSSKHPQKESIAFVAGTAQSLIYKLRDPDSVSFLQIDTISPILSSVILFLIGNSQADASESAEKIHNNFDNLIESKLTQYIKALAKGDILEILENPFNEKDAPALTESLQQTALNYLWIEIGLGIYNMAANLMKKKTAVDANHFDNVIDLAVSKLNEFNQSSIFTGPCHLALLLKILEEDILMRAVTNITAPLDVDRYKWSDFLQKLSKNRPYLWENHKSATDTDFLNRGVSAVLTLPTGAGKSTLSELKIASCFLSGKKTVYLVPTHALKDQVRKNLENLFREYNQDNIELDGEYTELGIQGASPIVVMTPERCLTVLNINPDFFDEVGLIVFDEFHLVHSTDFRRNSRSIDAMYCLISLFTLVPQADYLLISAMVENGNKIAEWVASVTGRDCRLFNSVWKPTRQLHGCLIFQEKDIVALKTKIRETFKKKETKSAPQSLKNVLRIKPFCFFSLKNIWETKDNNDYYQVELVESDVSLGIGSNKSSWYLTTNRNDIAAKLGSHFSNLGLKTLIFVDNPRNAKSTAERINKNLSSRTNSYDDYMKNKTYEIESLKHELGNLKFSYFVDYKNVGVHHGLLLPVERYLIENYFKEGAGSISLVATATLAQGINLPAEIVIIAGDDRYDDELKGRERIPPHELLNAAGRAGRAGQSAYGAVILIPGELVTIRKSKISDRWWSLKNEVFSKSDQCLKIEDPFEYFLDSLQEEGVPLDDVQTNILFRFKTQKLSETDTRKILKNSFYAFNSRKEHRETAFEMEVENLLERRNKLDLLSEDILWTKEISYKTGIDPIVILELGKAIDNEELETFIGLSVVEYIEWYLEWLRENYNFINKIFTKTSTIKQIKKLTNSKSDDLTELGTQLPKLKCLVLQYVKGDSLMEINRNITTEKDDYLINARNFAIRLMPEISFSFGLLTMVTIEKAKQSNLQKEDLPWTLKALSSCIREGFDDVNKLFYRHNNDILTRVETHLKFAHAR